MISYIDTSRVSETAREINSLANDLNTEIDSLYKRLGDVPRNTKEWVGGQANFYFSRVAQDKPTYVAIVNNLRRIAQELESEAHSVETSIKTINS